VNGDHFLIASQGVRKAVCVGEGCRLEVEDWRMEFKGNLRVAFPDGWALSKYVYCLCGFSCPVGVVVSGASVRYVFA
jgi:hypothetical protein